MHRNKFWTMLFVAGLLLALLSSSCGGQVSVSIATHTPPVGATATPLPSSTPSVEKPLATDRPLPTTAPTSPPVAPATATTAPTSPPAAPATATTALTSAAGEHELRQWAVLATASSEWGDPDWAAMQAVGQPDTHECEDLETAWASGPSDQVEWLELRYATPVRPTQVSVVQSYEPDQVARIEILDMAGNYHTVYTGQPREVSTCPYVLSVPVQADYQAAAVRVIVDQSGRDNWNEIDAVELVGWVQPGAVGPAPTLTAVASGNPLRQWGSGAKAGSEYDSPDYAAQQAAGAPDTLECDDLGTAWASAESNGVDWLEVYYTTPVRPAEVRVVQNYNPGQVVRVELLDTAGVYHEVYVGEAELEGTCPYVLSVGVKDANYRAVAVRITVDQSLVSDWNEIDAIELVGWTE